MKKLINYNYISIYYSIKIDWPIGLVVEYLPMAQETGVQSQVESYQRLKKMVLDTSLLNTQHYNVPFKGKVGQSRERSNPFSYTSV